MSVVQLIDQSGNAWPVYWDTVTGNISWNFSPPPGNIALGVERDSATQDCRISVRQRSHAGSRATFTWYGPDDDGRNYHVSAAYGSANTGFLGARWGLANSGLYFMVVQPATADQFGAWGGGARYIGFGNWNDPAETPKAEVHVHGTMMADNIQFANGDGSSPIDLQQQIATLQQQVAALQAVVFPPRAFPGALGEFALGEG